MATGSSNDFVDAAVTGTIKIEAPPGLRILPAEIAYKVPANDERFYSFTVMAESENWVPGFIIASLEQNGQRLYDICEFGLPEKSLANIQWRAEKQGNDVVVIINNPFSQSIEGQVSLIGPVESWGMPWINPIGLTEVTPWQRYFSVPAKGESRLKFSLQAIHSFAQEEVTQWLVARLSCFGYVDYKAAWGDLEIKGQVKELE